eukprot:Em0009g967a
MSVIIIGAGFAGLGAASLLSSKCHVTILEGNDYIGGRAKTAILSDVGGKSNHKTLELGCTFLHGSEGNALYSIATLHHVIEEQHHHLPKTVNILSNGEKLSEEAVDRYRELFYEVQTETVRRSRANDWTLTVNGHPRVAKEDTSTSLLPVPPTPPSSRADLSNYFAGRFRELSVSHADDHSGPGVNTRPVLDNLLREEGLDNGTKLSEGVDLLSYGDFDLSEDGLEDCAIAVVGGYSTIVGAAAAGIPSGSFRMKSEVERIRWSPQTTSPDAAALPPVQVVCSNGDVYEADHVIVTVSLGVLQGRKDLFEPPLPSWKQATIDKLAIGVVNKVALQFTGPLIEEEHDAIAFFWMESDGDDLSGIPPWAKCQSKIDRLADTNVYTAWFCGEDAHAVELLSDEELVSGMVSTLELFLKRAVERPAIVGRSSWGRDRLFLGSYSYNPHGASKEDRLILSKHVDGTTPMQLLFAGEATHPSLFSTTHGAFESGQREARRLHVEGGRGVPLWRELQRGIFRMSSRKRSRGADAVHEEDIPGAKRNKDAVSDDAEMEDDGDDEEEDLEMSQLLTQDERGTTIDAEMGREADVGILEKITLVNFMCHKRFDVQFGPNVNFVLGRNGSGKSAIMNAVVVALGGKATATQRGTSLKQFVRSGASHSEVIVHLRNRGHDAYRHDVYGDTIVVERHIRSDGTGTYKLKSGSTSGNRGTIVSTKKEELQHILDHLNIQIDNPVSLLSQETSRNFLHSSDPKNKYKLFMKATQLEKICQDYEATRDNLDEMKRGIERKKQFLPEVQQEAKRLEEKLQEFQALESLEMKLLDLKKELQWSMVTQLEQSVEPYKADIEKERLRLTRNQAKIDQAKTFCTTFDAECQELNQKMEGACQKAAAVNERKESLSSELRGKQKKFRDAEAIATPRDDFGTTIECLRVKL